MSFEAAMKIFELSKSFPVDERYSNTDQIIRLNDLLDPYAQT
jgi:hypothetical protein